jgi:hypothetical protein
MDTFTKDLEQWKKDKPEKFDYLKTLLSKPFVTSEEYKKPVVFIYYPSDNFTLASNDELQLSAYVRNDNPLEIRRALWLYLEEMKPDSSSFEQQNSIPQIIQTNDYNEKTNSTTRAWPDMTSFKGLKSIGDVKFRIKVTDGQYTYYSSNMTSEKPPFFRELKLRVENNPPEMNEMRIIGPESPRYSDPLIYTANVTDLDGDLINITLYVMNDNKTDLFKVVQEVKPGKITFKSSDYAFFGEKDAGESFYYKYSYSDGINTSFTEDMPGPSLRPSPKIEISNMEVIPENANAYWWQMYNFSLKVYNPSSDEVKVSLLTTTPANPNVYLGEQKVMPHEEKTVVFNAHPFEVSDCNQTFKYSFRYSAPDQYGEEMNETLGLKISPKLVQYTMYSPGMLLNIGLLILLPLLPILSRRFSVGLPSLVGLKVNAGIVNKLQKKGGN